MRPAVYFISSNFSEETSFNWNNFLHFFPLVAFLLTSFLATTLSNLYILLLDHEVLFTLLYNSFLHDWFPFVLLRLGRWATRQTREALFLDLQIHFLGLLLIKLFELFFLLILHFLAEHVYAPRVYLLLSVLFLLLNGRSSKRREICLWTHVNDIEFLLTLWVTENIGLLHAFRF